MNSNYYLNRTLSIRRQDGMNSALRSFLQQIRTNQANRDLIQGSLSLAALSFIGALILIITEALFYTGTEVRTRMTVLYAALFLSGIFYLIIRYLIYRNGWLQNASDEEMARWVGRVDPDIRDRLLNAYQLENTFEGSGPSADLINAAVDRVVNQLNTQPEDRYRSSVSRRVRNYSIMATVLFFISVGIYNDNLIPAAERLIHPGKEYPVPLPFTLTSLSGDQDILGGDSVTVAFTGVGELPDSIILKWDTRNSSQSVALGKKDQAYTYQFRNVNEDMAYQAEVRSRSWLSRWDVIATEPDTIRVKDRPVIEDVRFTVIPPVYTGEQPWQHPGNITDITALSGSSITIHARSTKPLSMAWVLMDSGREMLTVTGRKITGSIRLTEDNSLQVFCLDLNDVANLNPTRYRLSAMPDFPPDLLIPRPDREMELDENMAIDFNIQTSDDYGFSSAWIEYRIIHPEYIRPDTNLYSHGIPELVPDVRSQQIFHTWDVSFLNLGPEDELRFHVLVADNNTLTGPSVTRSPEFVARYPSLEDMYMALETEEETADDQVDAISMTLEDIRELVEELELDLLKSDEVNWEHTQKAEEVLEKMEDIRQQMESLQENMEKINEQIEKNNLTSDPLMEKFSKLQELLESIMTPELLEAMEKLQEAMAQMDPEKMLEALENFDVSAEELEEQLDRFIDMFQQAMAEQKLDEVVKRLEKMVEEQTDIVEEMAKNPDEKTLNQLASQERRQEERFSGLKEEMESAAEAMKDFAPQPAEDMQQLKQSELTEKTQQELTDARKAMQNSDMQQAGEQSEGAQQDLQEMLQQAQDIQQQYQDQTVKEMMADFQKVMQNTLSISQRQEQLRRASAGLRSNSPKLAEIANVQDRIRRQTNQLFGQLTELSKKTFYISPKIGRALGMARVSMDKSIASLEQKSVSSALRSQKAAMEGLNEAAKLMLGAMDQMQSSGSASGFEAFLEQMEQMSQQQQGINQGTMQLGQMGMMAQQQMMQRLQAQQQQLQQSLQELLNDMPGEGNDGLGKALEDMEEVVKDFKRRQVNRRTMERQERILSRMLDSQKSLTRRDYSEKRKSNTGEEFIYSGPAGLPADMGEREMLLIKAMENALNEGHSREYQSMMKTYFRNLQKETEKQEKADDTGE